MEKLMKTENLTQDQINAILDRAIVIYQEGEKKRFWKKVGLTVLGGIGGVAILAMLVKVTESV